MERKNDTRTAQERADDLMAEQSTAGWPQDSDKDLIWSSEMYCEQYPED